MLGHSTDHHRTVVEMNAVQPRDTTQIDEGLSRGHPEFHGLDQALATGQVAGIAMKGGSRVGLRGRAFVVKRVHGSFLLWISHVRGRHARRARAWLASQHHGRLGHR